MRFLADMGVDIRVVQWLRQIGHDAKHLREEGLHRFLDFWKVSIPSFLPRLAESLGAKLPH